MYVRFIWQTATGGMLGPDGDVFEPSENAAQPSDDALGAWHPFGVLASEPHPPAGPQLAWRRCLVVTDYDKYVEEFNHYTLQSAQDAEDE